MSEFCACQIAGVESGTNRIFSLQLNAPDRLNRPSKTLNHSVFPALIFWSALSVILHAFYINTPFVNLEYVFAQATQSLLDPETGMSNYFSMQANPLGYVWFSTLFHFLMGEPEGFWSYRLASVSGLVAILGAGAVFTSSLKPDHNKEFHLWCALVTFSPLIWLFSGRATADILPVGLLLLSFALVFKSEAKPVYRWLSPVIFLSAILVKYHALLMAPGFIYIFWCQNECQFNRAWVKKCGQFFLLPLLGFFTYLWVIYNQYGFFLAPDNHSQLEFGFANFIKTFSLYASYLGILLGPLALVSILSVRKNWSEKWWVLSVAGLGLGVWTRINPFGFQGGEMNYGPLDGLLNGSLVFLVKGLGGIFFCFLVFDCFFEANKNKNAVAGFILTVCLPFLLICSATRPAQRYLVFLIPLIFYFLVFYKLQGRIFFRSVLGWGTVAVFVLANIFAVNYQVAQARASDNMAQWLIENKMIEQTHPGSIYSNSGQYFTAFVGSPKTHRVLESSGDVKTSLHSEKVVVFGKTLKTYYLPVPQKNL